MSTRSYIGQVQEDGTILGIYCHFDGYLEGVGKDLATHWTDPAKVTELIGLGSLSVLGSEVGEQHDFVDARLSTVPEGWCLAYGRDRGETGQEARRHDSVADFLAAAQNCANGFAYLFTDSGWVVYLRSYAAGAEWTEARPLVDALAADGVIIAS